MPTWTSHKRAGQKASCLKTKRKQQYFNCLSNGYLNSVFFYAAIPGVSNTLAPRIEQVVPQVLRARNISLNSLFLKLSC